MGLEWLTGQRPKPTHIVLQGELCARILALARQLEALRCALGLETVLAKLRAGDQRLVGTDSGRSLLRRRS